MKGRLFSIHYFTVLPDGLQFLKKPTSNLNAFQTTLYVEEEKIICIQSSVYILEWYLSGNFRNFFLQTLPVRDLQPSKVKINHLQKVISLHICTYSRYLQWILMLQFQICLFHLTETNFLTETFNPQKLSARLK